MFTYRAFDLSIASEFELPLLLPMPPVPEPEVVIRRENLAGYEEKALFTSKDGLWFYQDESRLAYKVEEGAGFLIENGNTIAADVPLEMPVNLLQVYLLGGCLGTLLNQRNILALHGSCVSLDGKTILITGESGAGKSTLAHEFVENGFGLLTDDISAIRFDENRIPYVVPSYPSQKMWQDAIDRYGVDPESLSSLWQEDRKEKFNVDSTAFFHNRKEKPDLIVWLIKGPEEYDGPCLIREEKGFSVVDRLMRNTYRGFLRDQKGKNILFQQCVDLCGKVRMLSVVRPAARNTAAELYEQILHFQ